MRKPSGRCLLRVPPALHRRLRGRARSDGRSLNDLCVRLLKAAFAAKSDGDQEVVRPPLDLAIPPRLLDAVAEAWKDSLVGIAAFGSAVRGEATRESDLDLLIVLDQGRPIERALYDRWRTLDSSLGPRAAVRISPQFVALPPSPGVAGGLWLEVAREGRVLYDRSGRLTRLLASLRDLMMAGAVVRRTIHGHPYWARTGSTS